MKKSILKLKELTDYLEQIAPLSTQESYDNSGLLAGSPLQDCSSALVCLDVTESVVDEAIKTNAQLIISHHPFIFGGLKKVTGKTEAERILMKVIRHNLAVYALHTPFDASSAGISVNLARVLGLQNIRILQPASAQLKKIVVFVPATYADTVRQAMFSAGAGHIGNYDSCSYNLNGEGSFRALEGSKPFVGKKGKIHFEKEVRIETIVPYFRTDAVIAAMKKVHPYEEVAFDVYPLDNPNPMVGFGAIGELTMETGEISCLKRIKKALDGQVLRHSELRGRPVKRIAVCGGSGAFLIGEAMKAGADFFVTADLKYHQFQETIGRMVVVDAGHFETEKVFLQTIKELLNKKFTTFAIRISKSSINPVNYL